ncbi:MAG: TetR/AcrR family transcriptional regulator [Acidobacteria bacterium]|nr:TetR/AcrR family transcriptional regulator [Acidobacteriota bacterium]
MLDRAMETFWSQGYDRTSIKDLVRRTGVNRASLYGAYPDKRALFIAGIRHYLDLVVENNIRRLRGIEPAGEAVRQFFLKLVDAPTGRIRMGCLLTNSAVEVGLEDREVAALIRGAFRRVEQAIRARLVEAQKANRLMEGAQPKALARLLITVLQGVRVMSRVGVERSIMRDAVTSALSAIIAQGDEHAAARGLTRTTGAIARLRSRRSARKK